MGRWWASFLLVMTGCAQAPTRELALAAGRIEQARAADADLYASDRFAGARAALDAARVAMESEGRYRAALELAAYAAVRADEARALAAERKRRWARDVDRLLRENAGLLDEARARGAARHHAAFLDALQQRYAELQQAYAEERFFETFEKGQVLKRDLLELVRTLR